CASVRTCRRTRRATSRSDGSWSRRCVPRETLRLRRRRMAGEAFHVKRLAERFELPPGADERLSRLLDALAQEPDPPTTVRSPAEAADVHVADSLAALALPQLHQADSMADLGSGAGFPGLVLAIALPHARVDL